ncbi:MAG: DNA repair protein RadC [Bacteroidales bacterium]
MNIKEWAENDRPREKMLTNGLTALSDAELIAILIGSGNKDKSAVELSREILLRQNNDLNRLGKITVKELTNAHKGIGPAKAISILAALELGRRRNQSEVIKNFTVTSSRDVYQYFRPILADLKHEEFWVAYLNQSNRVIHRKKISKGGVSETAVDIRIILKDAIEQLASGLILCHNHPSGNNKPSAADDSFTKKIKEAARLMDIRVLDHLIVCEDCYFSYADEGKI